MNDSHTKESEMSQAEKFEQWAIVDVMGHQRYVGLVTEQVIAGTGFVRVDVPANGEVAGWTKLIGAQSIYAITPVSEEIARDMAKTRKARPVSVFDLTPRLASSVGPDDDDMYDDN